jgi:uncharacterized coiled-coil protein SlyX
MQDKIDNLEIENEDQHNKINNLETKILGLEQIINRMRTILKI